MKKVAVIGSRQGVLPQDIALCINDLYEEHGTFILVSGGGPEGSTNFVAEQTALEFGLPVISFRPTRLADYGTDEQYGVVELRLHRGTGKQVMDDLTWKDFQSALNYRSMLIAERADEAVAFHHGKSRGTAFEIELLQTAGKPVSVVES